MAALADSHVVSAMMSRSVSKCEIKCEVNKCISEVSELTGNGWRSSAASAASEAQKVTLFTLIRTHLNTSIPSTRCFIRKTVERPT